MIRYANLFNETNNRAEVIHKTGCFAIVQDPLAKLDTRALSNSLLDKWGHVGVVANSATTEDSSVVAH